MEKLMDGIRYGGATPRHRAISLLIFRAVQRLVCAQQPVIHAIPALQLVHDEVAVVQAGELVVDGADPELLVGPVEFEVAHLHLFAYTWSTSSMNRPRSQMLRLSPDV